MSRSGLTKNMVKQARDVLISQNKYPSVDAVRIELGNTGSKSTIHKYLKELEEDGEQSIGQNLSVSETIQSLVIRLAEQLHIEANVEVEKIKETSQINEERFKEEIQALRNELSQTKMVLQECDINMNEQQKINEILKTSLDQEIIAKNRLEQQVVNLNESLKQNKEYLCSLEEKFKIPPGHFSSLFHGKIIMITCDCNISFLFAALIFSLLSRLSRIVFFSCCTVFTSSAANSPGYIIGY